MLSSWSTVWRKIYAIRSVALIDWLKLVHFVIVHVIHSWFLPLLDLPVHPEPILPLSRGVTGHAVWPGYRHVVSWLYPGGDAYGRTALQWLQWGTVTQWLMCKACVNVCRHTNSILGEFCEIPRIACIYAYLKNYYFFKTLMTVTAVTTLNVLNSRCHMPRTNYFLLVIYFRADTNVLYIYI